MHYKRIRYAVGACLVISYFVIFCTPLAEFLSLADSKAIARKIYIFAECAVYFLIGIIQNRMARKKGEEPPYPNFPYLY